MSAVVLFLYVCLCEQVPNQMVWLFYNYPACLIASESVIGLIVIHHSPSLDHEQLLKIC